MPGKLRAFHTRKLSRSSVLILGGDLFAGKKGATEGLGRERKWDRGVITNSKSKSQNVKCQYKIQNFEL
jgi:hypothetical protein